MRKQNLKTINHYFMKEFYLVRKINKIIPSKSKREIVTKMREIDWNSKSDNKDYMHVYAFWRNKKSNIKIRYENEIEFVNDLIKYNQIVKVSFWNYFAAYIVDFFEKSSNHHKPAMN